MHIRNLNFVILCWAWLNRAGCGDSGGGGGCEVRCIALKRGNVIKRMVGKCTLHFVMTGAVTLHVYSQWFPKPKKSCSHFG